ncbi:imidazolonepropionase-like domain-containing protein [Kitasatospora sp. NPDC052868]|uniref:amidohydrolase family protein n=1 Tax=Kitasatospora sp. NPDC052868 TaxID=3364060 RepID=UPI0037C9B375
MLTLHRAALVLPDPADPTAPPISDGAVVVQGERIAALGPFGTAADAYPQARVRDWGDAVLTPGLCNPYGRWLLECAYHPDPREGVGSEPVPGGLVGAADGPAGGAGGADPARYGASARRGLQRMLGFGVTAVAGPFEHDAVRMAVARSGLAALGGPVAGGAGGVAGAGVAGGSVGGEGPLDPLAVLPLAAAVYGRLTVGGRADFAVFGADDGVPRPGGCLATVLAGRLLYRRR